VYGNSKPDLSLDRIGLTSAVENNQTFFSLAGGKVWFFGFQGESLWPIRVPFVLISVPFCGDVNVVYWL
jgi:hypothetical protein